MGKQGPCCHCGVTSTPLWRNGPPEKPVLCNACGSRWRTKLSLDNYTPLHARAEPDEYGDKRISRYRNLPIYKNKEVKLLKRKQHQDNGVVVGVVPDHAQSFHKAVDEDTSNRSSSGSAISNSESCAQFGGADASDLTGPAQSMVWEAMVPSRKRTCVGRQRPSPVEKLTKDLYTILREQQSYFSGSSEEDLLFERETPMVSVEIGHGSVLIRHPSSIAREEESEASSLSVDNKQFSVNEAYSESSILPAHSETDNNVVNFSTSGFGKKHSNGQGLLQEQIKWDKAQGKLQPLGNHDSPLCHIDLTDILNFGEFMKQLTNEEQRQLMKFLPSVDAEELPYSLNRLFESPQFEENLNSFKQLLAEGVFDFSFPGVKTEDCKTLRRLVLSNFSKSKWVEQYHILKKCNSEESVVQGPAAASSSSMNAKKLLEDLNKKNSETKTTMKSPNGVIAKTSMENKELIDSDGSCFSPRSLFALPTDGGSFMLESLHFEDENSDHDLLLDVRSNSSFPQAELLHPALAFSGQQASNSSSSVNPHFIRY